MTPIQKKIIELCNAIWKFRKKRDIWIDKEIEQQQPELLVYKRLDGLRSILFLLNQDIISINDLSFKKEFLIEINDLVRVLKDLDYFYPSPYIYLVEIQPDDYTDMASHCLIFGLSALKLPKLENSIKADIRILIEKSLDCLTKKENFYYDKSEKLCAWAGTTQHQFNKADVELKSVSFTAQVLIALGEWLKNPESVNPQSASENKIKEIKEIINCGCRWILTQKNNKGNILITNTKKVDNISTDELITVNSIGLKACLLNLENVSKTTEKKLIEDSCINFINFLKIEKPKSVDWYHTVLSKKVGMQYYENRQETLGVISFLALANQVLNEKSPPATEDIVEYFINEFFSTKLELVSIIPYYTEDFFYIHTFYSKLFANITINLKTIRKAIKRSVTDQSLIDFLSNAVIKNITEISNEDNFKNFDDRTKRKS